LAIAIAISLSVSVYGPMTVKEREEGIIWQLFLNGTRRINYWIGIFISDAICIFIPIILIAIVGFINEINIFESRIIIYTLFITVQWIIGSLLHQYAVAHFFRKYDRCMNLFLIVNPTLTLLTGIYCLFISLMTSMITQYNEDMNTDILDRNHDMEYKQYWFYLFLMLFAPVTIVLYYAKISSFVGSHKLRMSQKLFKEYINSKVYQSIIRDTSLNEIERNKKVSTALFNMCFPSFSDMTKSFDLKMIVLLATSLILICGLLLFWRERRTLKNLKCYRKYTEKELAIKNKKMEKGPIDVYNEFKRIDESMKSKESRIKNTIALKVYRLNKDYPMKLSQLKKLKKKKDKEFKNKKEYEMKYEQHEYDHDYEHDYEHEYKYRFENEKKIEVKIENKDKFNNKSKKEYKDENKNENENENENKKNVFERMDHRIIYDKSKGKYANRVVGDVTFGVDVGQCLGLLGPNGAGKTTSISMITGIISRTHGDIVYGDKNLNDTDLSKLSLGYCPQHNSLWKLLTVKETIEFYLNICGYPPSEIPHFTQSLIKACGIETHTRKRISEISGGTKRKLSLIIAICSSPNILILDEPSAGMDPFTRRYMWKLVSELKKYRETATILTTHSTEEAEALCDRLAILIKGNLVCCDSLRCIKMNQSHRYVLEVFTDHPEQFEVMYVRKENLFGLSGTESYDLESSIAYQKYFVEMKTENISNVFAIMEKVKASGLIHQYNFGQYSIEQVYLDFIKNTQ